MGHRQDMTHAQRLIWDSDNYKKRLDANRGSNYEYWCDKHDTLLDNGWERFSFLGKGSALDTCSESEAKDKVTELRLSGNFARIVCITNRLRIKTFSVIFKPRKV